METRENNRHDNTTTLPQEQPAQARAYRPREHSVRRHVNSSVRTASNVTPCCAPIWEQSAEGRSARESGTTGKSEARNHVRQTPPTQSKNKREQTHGNRGTCGCSGPPCHSRPASTPAMGSILDATVSATHTPGCTSKRSSTAINCCRGGKWAVARVSAASCSCRSGVDVGRAATVRGEKPVNNVKHSHSGKPVHDARTPIRESGEGAIPADTSEASGRSGRSAAAAAQATSRCSSKIRGTNRVRMRTDVSNVGNASVASGRSSCVRVRVQCASVCACGWVHDVRVGVQVVKNRTGA